MKVILPDKWISWEELTHSDIKDAIGTQKNKALENDNRNLSSNLKDANDLVEYWRKKYNYINKKYKIERDKINRVIDFIEKNDRVDIDIVLDILTSE